MSPTCKNCLICASFNEGGKRRAKLYLIPSTALSHRVAMDYEGPLPETGNGNKHILVFQDGVSKDPIAIPTKDQTQETTAAAFLRWLVIEHGVPFELISDNGSAFPSELFTLICKKLG